MKIKLKTGWLVHTITYSTGNEGWQFSKERPSGDTEHYDGKTGAFTGLGTVKKIAYVEVEVEDE